MKTKIYQIYFEESQKQEIPDLFHNFNNTANPRPELREYYIFKTAYESGLCEKDQYTGFFSWSFFNKSQFVLNRRITPSEVFEFMGMNKGYDVYLFNFFPGDAKWFRNVWQQGDGCHYNMGGVANELFYNVGRCDKSFKYRDFDVYSMNHGDNEYVMCNYWVANKKVWDLYMDFTLPIYNYIFGDKIPEPLRQRIWSETFHDGKVELSYFSFIFERFFSTLLSLEPDIRSIGWTKDWKEKRI